MAFDLVALLIAALWLGPRGVIVRSLCCCHGRHGSFLFISTIASGPNYFFSCAVLQKSPGRTSLLLLKSYHHWLLPVLGSCPLSLFYSSVVVVVVVDSASGGSSGSFHCGLFVQLMVVVCSSGSSSSSSSSSSLFW